MIKHIENFSGDLFTLLASWPSGRARGKARMKMVGPGPTLSIASAATALDEQCQGTEGAGYSKSTSIIFVQIYEEIAM